MKPRATAVVVCDQILHDATAGKRSLIGIFDRIWAREFPVRHGSMGIYARIEGAPKQEILLALRMVSPSGHIEGTPPRQVTLCDRGSAQLAIEYQGAPFDVPGEHRLVVMANDEEVGDTAFRWNNRGKKPHVLKASIFTGLGCPCTLRVDWRIAEKHFLLQWK